MKKILILFSDTGGGHRAAAEAIRDALDQRYADRYETALADGIVQGALPPVNRIPKLYLPTVTYAPWGWGFLFKFTNARGARWLNPLIQLVTARGLRKLFVSAKPDVVVTVHPLLTRSAWRIWKKFQPNAPFITVITDLFDPHRSWYSAPADLLIVATEGARQRGVGLGFPADRIKVTGLPVHQNFVEQLHADNAREVSELRARLGLAPDCFTILIIGGGEGMGRIAEIARALANADLPIQLVIVAGRNESLKKKLEAEKWNVPVRVNGFVTNMPDWMRASDLVITKAGPATIMETLAAGRPLLLSGYLPGQEKGNVDFVLQSGVGVLRATPPEIAEQVREWLGPENDALEKMRARARDHARPRAALEIAKLVDQVLKQTAGE